MKIIVTFAVGLIIGGAVMYFVAPKFFGGTDARPDQSAAAAASTDTDTDAAAEQPAKNNKETVIGVSVDKNNITAYHFGTGETELLFVGGVHGGYSWSTALVAYELMDYLTSNPKAVPENVRVTVVPVLNPDGLKKATGKTGRFTKDDVSTSAVTRESSRFNANSVDLNRNFDCDWQTKGTWQKKQVSGGSSAFSEPESAALKGYVDANKPAAAVVWFSAGGGVYASNCGASVALDTKVVMDIYAKSAGYKAYEKYDSYEITGDMVNWLAKLKIPAISVLLTSHDSTEWSKNRAGVEALLKKYAQ